MTKSRIFLGAIAFSLFLFTGCQESGSGSGDKETDENQEAFQELLKSVPTAKLPLSTHCAATYPDAKPVDEEAAKILTAFGERLWKQLPTGEDYAALIFLAPADIDLPVLRTYTSGGKLIDQRQLFTRYCGGEPGFFQSEYFEITPELKILHTDTTKNFEVDDNGMDRTETEEISVEKEEMRIDVDGKITTNTPG